MRAILIFIAIFIGYSHAFAASNRCSFVENQLDEKATCHFMGKRGEETKSALITPNKKISTKAASAMLFQVVGAFDMSAYHPELITVLTDTEAKGESVSVDGEAAHWPKSNKQIDPTLEAKFLKHVQVCKAVNWESRCRPLQQPR